LNLLLQLFFLPCSQPVAATNHDGREDQHRKTGKDQMVRLSTGALPLLEQQSPHVTEHDDKCHVNRPARETILPHPGRSHSVEHELAVPGCSCHGREEDVRQDRRAGDIHVVASRTVLNVQKNTPDQVCCETAGENHDEHRAVLPEVVRLEIGSELRDRLSRRKAERHAGAHYPGKDRDPNALYEVEFRDGGLLLFGGEFPLLAHAGASANSDSGQANSNARQREEPRRIMEQSDELALKDRRDERTEGRTEAQR
jgi:hypothetical protein